MCSRCCSVSDETWPNRRCILLPNGQSIHFHERYYGAIEGSPSEVQQVIRTGFSASQLCVVMPIQQSISNLMRWFMPGRTSHFPLLSDLRRGTEAPPGGQKKHRHTESQAQHNRYREGTHSERIRRSQDQSRETTAVSNTSNIEFCSDDGLELAAPGHNRQTRNLLRNCFDGAFFPCLPGVFRAPQAFCPKDWPLVLPSVDKPTMRHPRLSSAIQTKHPALHSK